MDADSRLKAVIFDCDGILVDTEPLHYQAFQVVLAPLGLGHDYDHYMEYYIGFDDRDAFREAFREAGRCLDEATLTRLMRAKAEALLEIVSKGVASFPGVSALVEELVKHGVPLAVASGALRHEVLTFMEALGLREAFPLIVAADDVSRSKPDPETYLVALERVREKLGTDSLDPSACIAIEDTPAGIQSAKAAGMYVVGVTNSFPADQLKDADQVVESLDQVSYGKMIQWLEK
ncbi:MAG: HAD family phosphatase [Deltaproteobacteria bacterium]|uniref:Haloacid dehalogenase n=1 Tax=Desulforhabdus amnigena TaxID=40218 RepID=A0A9W6L9A7_9BACT|nr:HAD family phosphatase [Deltaproteobacteria bacterium]GLI36418.1 haloacid dehalogenase [Desulforhabdus amnigena]